MLPQTGHFSNKKKKNQGGNVFKVQYKSIPKKGPEKIFPPKHNMIFWIFEKSLGEVVGTTSHHPHVVVMIVTNKLFTRPHMIPGSYWPYQ